MPPGAPPDPGPPDAGRAWGWVAALRDGSTTPWAQWSAGSTAGSPAGSGTAAATARDVPGAQQLELLRRVNAAAPRGARADLAERILAVGATGRGGPDLELVGAVARQSWGPPPIDPATLEDAELLRFAATLLAEDVVIAGQAESARRSLPRPLEPVAALPSRVRRRLRRRAVGHRLVGDPWLVAPLRKDLVRQGRPLGTPHSSVVVVGADLATMLADTFLDRAFDDGVVPWQRWLQSSHGDRSLPPRVDLSLVARRWSEEVGPERVSVLLDPTRVAETLPLPPRATSRLSRRRPSANATDLARRVAAPLGLLVPPEERRHLLRQVLLPTVLADDAQHPGAALGVPESLIPRVVRQAEQMRDDLAAAGYPVVGDLETLVPHADVSGSSPDPAAVLALAVRLLLAGPLRPRSSRGEEEDR